MARQKITPFLWFDTQAEQAANYYVSLFPDSAVTGVTPGPDGQVLVVEFRLAGFQYYAMNGGPHFHLTEAFSLTIDCSTQAEVDHYWDTLSAGGETSQCGWLKDQFGLSWQITPTILLDLIADPDRAKAGRAMNAMMGMTKINIQEIRDAAAAE